jgi:hypothetical protein
VILLLAVFSGLLVAIFRAQVHAQVHDRSLRVPALRHIWLVLLASLPQWIAFGLPATARQIPQQFAALALVSSQLLLLTFILLNHDQAGAWLLGFGLALNLSAIIANGGLMPISPQTVARLLPDAAPGSWQIGQRLGLDKDIILPLGQMHLPWLADRFLLPAGFPWQAAFSLGDVLIALGALKFTWAMGGPAVNPFYRRWIPV